MKRHSIYFLVFLILVVSSCKKEEIDETKPIIDYSATTAFPVNCSVVQKGESFTFEVLFSDNVELGSYSIDIHHNFDHHSHSTEVETCELDPIKTPVNPFLFIQSYTIPSGQKEYTASETIDIPDDVDVGDYHFMYKVTDASGWQSIVGFSIKIVE
jgi:hypothetical protein